MNCWICLEKKSGDDEMEEKHIYVLKKLLNYEFDNIIDKLGLDRKSVV